MLCERCHKNVAAARYAEVVDGKVKDMAVCPDCLALYQRQGEGGFELTKPGLTDDRHKTPVRSAAEALRGRERCRTCGLVLAQVMESGRVGCGTCYESFAEQVESILEGLHTGVRHRGKAPHVDDARLRVQTDLQTKRALLRSALRMENYEEAARLRDEIRVLEAGLLATEEEE